MPTNNPKVSAYVPQHIFDRFKEYCEGSKLSMSQAVIAIFSEYFGVDQKVDQGSIPVGNGVLSRLEVIEQKLSVISVIPNEPNSELLEKVNQLTDLVASLEERLASLETIKKQPDEVEKVDTTKATEQAGTFQEVEAVSSTGEPSSEPQVNQLKIVLPDADVSELLAEVTGELPQAIIFEPLSTKALALRLGVSQPTMSAKKGKLSEQKFVDWMNSKDPDGMNWAIAGDYNDRFTKYVPAEDNPPEKLLKLNGWLQRSKHLF